MNALEILQKVYNEAGGPDPAPTTITGLSDFEGDCMQWVDTAWAWTQALRQDWWWKWLTVEKSLTIDQTEYDPVSDWSLSDVRYWKIDDVVIWDPSVGVSDQITLDKKEAADWRAKWGLRSHDANRPIETAVLEDGKLGIGGKPDIAYSVRLRYYQQNTKFTSNNDVPGIPAEYHYIIVMRALMLWAIREENTLKYQMFESEVKRWELLLMNDPRIGTGYGDGVGALA